MRLQDDRIEISETNSTCRLGPRPYPLDLETSNVAELNVADDPFPLLIIEALNLLHPRFAGALGLSYTADEAVAPGAARKDRERSFLMEFYHQFRRLWDKALPVQLGIGHIVLQSDPSAPAGRKPDFAFWQLGEGGRPDRRLGVMSLVFASNVAAMEADLRTLARYRCDLGYPYAICAIVGHSSYGLPEAAGASRIFYDTDRRTATMLT